MRQLVGVPCIFCKQRIESDWEGRFCLDCGSPSHNSCREAHQPDAAAGACSNCGAPKETVRAAEQERLDKAITRVAQANQRQGMKEMIGGGLVLLFGLACLLGLCFERPRKVEKGLKNFLVKGAFFGIPAGVAGVIVGFRRAATSKRPSSSQAPGREGGAGEPKSWSGFSEVVSKNREGFTPRTATDALDTFRPDLPPTPNSGNGQEGPG